MKQSLLRFFRKKIKELVAMDLAGPQPRTVKEQYIIHYPDIPCDQKFIVLSINQRRGKGHYQHHVGRLVLDVRNPRKDIKSAVVLYYWKPIVLL